jgi:Tfp pilus assembly protein PilX
VPRSIRSDERGIALALALFAMVISTLLITAVFYIARHEQRMGNSRIAATQAREAAEAGLSAVVANWNTTSYNALAPGATVALPATVVGGGASYAGSIRRLTPTTFLVQAEGAYKIGGQTVTRRQLARIVRLNQPSINMNAAVTTRVGITVSGSSQISGSDTVPASMAATCPPPGPAVPGIRDSSGAVSTSGACSGASCISGNPRILTDPSVSSSTFNQFGDLSFTDVAAMATLTVSGTVTGLGPTTNAGPPVSCRTGDATNWGDPLNPAGACGGYFPIVYSPGDLRLSGGWGQGILLVAGDLEIAGGVEFYGPVIVLGHIRSTGTGGHIFGGLMAENADFEVNLLSGNSVVSYSTCSINRALQGSSRTKALRERSWAQAF